MNDKMGEYFHIPGPEELDRSLSPTVAATLNIDQDEDGPPIAKSFTHNGELLSIIAVADGLGGSGSRRVKTPDGEKSMAYIAARTVQQSINNLINIDPQIFTTNLEQIRDNLQKSFEENYGNIKAEIPKSMIKGSIVREFPTTFSSALIQETNDEKKVNLFWSGDSPLFIFTPNSIFTTYLPDSGDAPVDSCITKNNYRLNTRQLTFPKDTPLLIVAASDGILKLGRDGLNKAINFILDGVQNNPLDKIGQNLTDEYQRLKQNGSIELDDTTIAMTFSMKPEEKLKLNSSAPIKTIYN